MPVGHQCIYAAVGGGSSAHDATVPYCIASSVSPAIEVYFQEFGIVASLFAWALPFPLDDQRHKYPGSLRAEIVALCSLIVP